ncbi:MAG TPA: hypothetical protein VJN93_05930 [Candidatus Acidoferrum sp.]|nr:hypothetical protein [Candidatus Acidoferrum sp.]
MHVRGLWMVLLSAGLLGLAACQAAVAAPAAQEAAKKDVVLKASQITARIFPESVFYRGQVAPVQMRNAGGVHFADGYYVLAGMVDASGYASDVKEKYQGYFLVEVPIEINGQSLKPGAYGIGFMENSKLVVTDVGGNTVLEIAGERDADIKRPVPLQVIAAPEAGSYRLYLGRNFVSIKRGS